MNTVYLLFLPVTVFLVLMAYVFYQNPKGWANRLFALYMLNLAMGVYVLLMIATTIDPSLAGFASVVALVTTFAFNGFFLIALILALYYPRVPLRSYALSLPLIVAILFSVVLFVDLVAQTGLIFVPHSQLGHGYVSTGRNLTGPAAPLLRVWLYLSMGITLVLLVVAWIRARPGERTPISLLLGSLFAIGVIMPVLPDNPLTPTLPAIVFSIVFAVVVGRYRILMSAPAILQAVFRNAIEGLIVCSPKGGVEQINPAATRLTGISAEAIGQPFSEAFVPFFEQIQQEEGEISLLEATTAADVETWGTLVRLAPPASSALEAAVIPIRDERDRSMGWLLTLRDVTDRERARQALAEQEHLTEVIRELSTPIIPVMEGVLVLPLVATIDRGRAQQIMEDMLQAIRRHRARVILIDITGVPVVDTMVGNYLLQAVKTARLLGCQGILVGIRANVARMLVDLGLDLSGLVTRASLLDGLEYAMTMLDR